MGAIAYIPLTITWRPNGLRFYVVVTSEAIVRQYDVATAWDVDGATYAGAFDFSTDSIQPEGLAISDDGLTVWVSYSDLYEYSLSTAWNIGTATLVQSEDQTPRAFTGSLSAI